MWLIQADELAQLSDHCMQVCKKQIVFLLLHVSQSHSVHTFQYISMMIILLYRLYIQSVHLDSNYNYIDPTIPYSDLPVSTDDDSAHERSNEMDTSSRPPLSPRTLEPNNVSSHIIAELLHIARPIVHS